jgi:hypothetical protein
VSSGENALAVGVLVGAVVGGVGRVLVTSLHVSSATDGTAIVLLTAGSAGVLIGAVAGLPGRPLLGAVVGAVVSGVVYIITLPVVLLFQALRTLSVPSALEVLAVGAVAGTLAGFAAQHWGRRAPTPSSPRT